MSLPHSDACFVKAYPGETTEAFCDGHVSGFSFFGGVPRSILYDNTRIAVARILGDGKRQRTRVFPPMDYRDPPPHNTAYRITLSGLVLLRPGGLILLRR